MTFITLLVEGGFFESLASLQLLTLSAIYAIPTEQGALWHFLPEQLMPPEGNAPPDKSILVPGCDGSWDQNNQQWCLKAAIAHE